jgi:hypothetical protein
VRARRIWQPAVKANGKGQIFSIDNEVGGMKHGKLLAREYQEFVTLIRANGEDWLAEQPDGSIGFMFEDADHSTDWSDCWPGWL